MDKKCWGTYVMLLIDDSSVPRGVTLLSTALLQDEQDIHSLNTSDLPDPALHVPSDRASKGRGESAVDVPTPARENAAHITEAEGKESIRLLLKLQLLDDLAQLQTGQSHGLCPARWNGSPVPNGGKRHGRRAEREPGSH